MAKVNVNYKDNASAADKLAATERAIKRFNKEVEKEGIIRTVLDRQYYVSKTEKRKKMEKAGRRKQLKQMYKQRNIEEL